MNIGTKLEHPQTADEERESYSPEAARCVDAIRVALMAVEAWRSEHYSEDEAWNVLPADLLYKARKHLQCAERYVLALTVLERHAPGEPIDPLQRAKAMASLG